MNAKAIFLGLTLLAFSACSKSHSGFEKGKLQDYTGLDGCGMLIDLDNGTTLDPTNLTDFQSEVNIVDGQNIWVKYHEIAAGSICMVGTVVEIEEMENR
jgi:hypothetical protein